MWPGWKITVKGHAVDRWLQRYSAQDRGTAENNIRRRMIVGLNDVYQTDAIGSKRNRALTFKGGHLYSERDKTLTVGDMKFVYSRWGRSVVVYTCYPVRTHSWED